MDSSAIMNALIAKLGGDAELLALMPNGVYRNKAPLGATRFVVLELLQATDGLAFEGRAFEDAVYTVLAVGLSSANPNMPAAAARIDALLDGGTLEVAGYTFMTMRRLRPRDWDEFDDLDRSIRWAHRGGEYQVVMST